MSWIAVTVQNIYPSAQSHFSSAAVASIELAQVAGTVDTSDSYDLETVKKILAADRGRIARAPKGAQEFLDWLNS